MEGQFAAPSAVGGHLINESRIDPKYKNGTEQYKDVLALKMKRVIIVSSY